MEPKRSLPHLKNVMAILTALTLSLCAFPDLTLAEISSSADSHPCQTDVNCELGSYCSSSGKCIPCAQCSIYSRLPKPGGNRQCAKIFNECGPCIPGYASKEDSVGMHSHGCFPLEEIFADVFATSTTLITGSVSENSSSSKLYYIALGGSLLGLLVACTVCCGILRLRRRYKPPSALHMGVENPPLYNFNGSDLPRFSKFFQDLPSDDLVMDDEQIEAGVVENSPFLSQEKLSVRLSTLQSPVAQSGTSPRSRPRISSRTVSDGNLRYVSFPSPSLSVTSSRSNFDLSPGIYAGVHVNRNGRWDSLRSLRHTTDEESALPLQSLQGAESGSEDLGFESRSEGRVEGSSTGTSHSSLPRNGLSVFCMSADSGILNENITLTAMKKDVDRDSNEGSIEDVGEVPHQTTKTRFGK